MVLTLTPGLCPSSVTGFFFSNAASALATLSKRFCLVHLETGLLLLLQMYLMYYSVVLNG